MVRRYHIIIALILLNIAFGYGQVLQLEPACAESTHMYGVSGFSDSEFIWSFDSDYGTVIEGNGTDSITIRWGYATGTVQLEVLEITNQNCSNIPSRAWLEIMAPDVDLGDEFQEICEEDFVIFNAGTHHEPQYSILWHDGSTGSEYIARNEEQIWVRVTDGFGCVRYDTVSLVVHPLPEPNLGNDTLLCNPGDSYILDPGNFSQYTWRISSEESELFDYSYYLQPVKSNVPDTIIVEVRDRYLCRGSDTLILFPCDFENLFAEMPNTITPNNDGVNDVWNIPYMDFFNNAVLEIFDRWGRLVFRSTKVSEEPWDGRSKGRDMPMDSYYFVLDLKVSGAKPIVGTVNLIR